LPLTCRQPCVRRLEDPYRTLKAAGEEVDHVITLGWRGAPDQQIRERLFDQDVLFLTQDEDWRRAILELLPKGRPDVRFELMDDGALLAWEQGPGGAWKAKWPTPQHGGPDAP